MYCRQQAPNSSQINAALQRFPKLVRLERADAHWPYFSLKERVVAPYAYATAVGPYSSAAVETNLLGQKNVVFLQKPAVLKIKRCLKQLQHHACTVPVVLAGASLARANALFPAPSLSSTASPCPCCSPSACICCTPKRESKRASESECQLLRHGNARENSMGHAQNAVDDFRWRLSAPNTLPHTITR